MTRRQAVPIIKPPVTWILVADGKSAQVYTRMVGEKRIPLAGNAKHPHYDEAFIQELAPVPAMDFKAESPEIYETGRDRLARVQESANSAHHMSEPHINIHEEIKRHLMKTVAARLAKALAEKSFDKLVLIAPPKMLGELREYLAPAVKKRIAAEMPKDLTHYEGEELLQHLRDSGLESA